MSRRYWATIRSDASDGLAVEAGPLDGLSVMPHQELVQRWMWAARDEALERRRAAKIALGFAI